ncbi:MAG TPA: HAMP domain-containing sensor histidine kinase [Clostridia bacterium]
MVKFRSLELKPSIRMILVNNAVSVIIGAVFYFLLPQVLNYPPYSINNDFQLKVSGIHYTWQYVLIVLQVIVFSDIFILVRLKKIDRLKEYLEINDKVEIEKIRIRCHTFPYLLYAVLIIVPALLSSVVLLAIGTNPVLVYKICSIALTFTTVVALITHVFTSKIMAGILYDISFTHRILGRRIGIRTKMYLQILPAFLAAILFTSLVCYSRHVTEKGNIIFEKYRSQLVRSFSGQAKLSRGEISEILQSIADEGHTPFLIDPEGNVEPEAIAKNKFFITYLDDIAFDRTDGHVYDYYGVDSQAAAVRVYTYDGIWTAGIKYDVTSPGTIELLGVSLMILIVLYASVLGYISKSMADDISRVAVSLDDIVHGENVDLDRKLPVTSNDEIGDLVVAFNKILELAKANIESIEQKQAILIERERLASLGQLIGGIAHNLRTPIMSISGAIEALKDLVYEYRDSIGDRSVNEQDHMEIAGEMLTWLDKMKPYCAYMSDVISAVKGQAVQMTASGTVRFTVDEAVKRVELLLKHELKRYHCVLNIQRNIDMRTEIKGEVSNLVQVLDNIIINAMQAYDGQAGTIDMEIVRSGDNVEFIIRDYGKGIPQNVANRLFKEMITTKGKKGTGLGLYMSYSTIRGRFGGNITFKSKEGCGTTFFISIPCITNGGQEEYR